MNGLQVFNNPRFGQIRTVIISGKTYFVAADVAKSLGYKRPTDAVNAHCKGTVKYSIPTNGGEQLMNVIPEGDIYRLAAKSELPGADEFESWIFDEVLPSIRKHGAYMTDGTIEKALLDPDFLIRLAINLKDEKQKRLEAEKKIQLDKPKVIFADSVTASKTSILVGELAKIIKQNGHDIGQNRLFQWLRDKGYLIKKKGESYNLPTQYSMDLGLFEIKKRAINNPDGTVITKTTTTVTGKGQIYFINKFKGAC